MDFLCNKGNAFLPNRYATIYYEVGKKLTVEIEEQMILATLFRYSKRSINKVFLTGYLCLSPNTITKYIQSLLINRHITIQKGEYLIATHVRELLQQFQENCVGRYLKIYHEHRLQLGLTVSEFALLYLYYSFSKNNAGAAWSRRKGYTDILNKTERWYYNTKKKFKEKGLIEDLGGHVVKLTPNALAHFNKLSINHRS